MTALCPCGSQQDYAACCQRLHNGTPAESPEALMRSRFSAFALGLDDYIQQSWHPDTCPQGPFTEAGTRWTQLQVQQASESGDEGQVTFAATFHAEDGWHQLIEQSRFVKQADGWKYLDGQPQWLKLQPGRNDACPCGSGSKFKKCCA